MLRSKPSQFNFLLFFPQHFVEFLPIFLFSSLHYAKFHAIFLSILKISANFHIYLTFLPLQNPDFARPLKVNEQRQLCPQIFYTYLDSKHKLECQAYHHSLKMIDKNRCKPLEGLQFKVELVEFISPVFFSVRLIEVISNRTKDERTQAELYGNLRKFTDFQEELQDFYSKNWKPFKTRVRVGLKCALKHTENLVIEYHRCIILEIL